ncbi:MAG: hypothetical protein V2A74_00435, partial [bacterium]
MESVGKPLAGFALFAAVLACLLAIPAHGETVCFVHKGKLVICEDDNTGPRLIPKTPAVNVPAQGIASYWGKLGDGRLIVSLSNGEPTGDDNSGKSGGPLALLHPDGTMDSIIAPDVLRAFPCPKNSVVALISPARELTIWRDGVTHAVRVDGRVSAAAWSPDGRFAVL